MSILDIAIFFVSANNKRKFEEQATEELYTSSFEEIPENGSIADKMIQEYKKTVFRIRMRIRLDPYHLVGSGSGSVSGSVDMDPGSAKGLLRQKVYIF